MEQIITITLSPAFDRHCRCDDFQPFCENLAQTISLDAGGKGINCSRALTVNGIQNLALVLLGKEQADVFCQALQAEKIAHRALLCDGNIRENLTLHKKDAPETRISFSGFSANDAVLPELDAVIKQETKSFPSFYLVFSGRIPNGISKASCIDFLISHRKRGARLVIDSKSFTKEDLISLCPFLIKPNKEELALLHPLGADDPLQAARDLQDAGVESVAVSLGAQGAYLVCKEGMFQATPPAVATRSTIGAGDSFLAGFLAAKAAGKPSHEALRTAVAYGSAACLRDGTKPPLPAEIARLTPLVKCQKTAGANST